MEIPLMSTSSLFFLLGVLVFLADLSGGAATATTTVYSTSKLIHRGSGDSGIGDPKDRRILGDKCSKSDIEINQGPTVPLPSGIPTYTVEITNNCLNGCKVSHIHLNCGKFSSATVINPKIFKRLRYNDCLVNDGKPLQNGHTISFKYANTFPYPLSVSSLVCI